MAYQLLDLKNELRKRIKDTSFDDELLISFINSTQSEILQHNRYSFMQGDDTAIVNVNQTEYSLDDDVDVLYSVKLEDDNKGVWVPEYLAYTQFFDRFSMDTASSSTPSHYTIFNGSLMWNAPLSRKYTMKLKYSTIPTTLTLDEDVPNIPERFKEVLMHGTIAKIEEYRDNYDVAALHQRKVEELSEDMLMRITIQQLGTLPKAKFGNRYR